MPRAAPWFVLAAAVVAADQCTKWLARTLLHPGERHAVTGFFNLVLAYNKGAAFSLFAGAQGWQTPLFAAIALLAAAVISVLLLRAPPRRRLWCLGLALILGGALGNLIDRLRYGYVVDFLDFHVGAWHWPAFNAADSAITLGAGLLILESFLQGRGRGHA